MCAQLNADDKAKLALADRNVVINSLSGFRTNSCPPWLRVAHPYPDGVLPSGRAAFAAVLHSDILEVISVRGPLHAIDGWSYLGRAFSSLLSGQAHTARHLCYYAELRAALSILASSGIGVFNRRNVVVDAMGVVHTMSEKPTHEMAWLALTEWSTGSSSMEQLVRPLQLAGASFMEPLLEFFPAQILTAAGHLMLNWGFDLRQGVIDSDQRNRSSYQPTALDPLVTSPEQDAKFLEMFWSACRPNGVALERHLLRIVLETEARSHNLELTDYESQYARLSDSIKTLVSFDFLTRVAEPYDNNFIINVADTSLPAQPYAMMCRAGLILRLATGMAEENLRVAGVQPADQFSSWWQKFGESHGLWAEGQPPINNSDLWGDIDLALEDCALAPTGHRQEWLATLSSNALRLCETERAALWGLFN